MTKLEETLLMVEIANFQTDYSLGVMDKIFN